MVQTRVQLAQQPPTQLWVGRSLRDAQGGMKTGQESFHSFPQHILHVSSLKERNKGAFNVGFTKYGSLMSLSHYDSALSCNSHCKDHMY